MQLWVKTISHRMRDTGRHNVSDQVYFSMRLGGGTRAEGVNQSHRGRSGTETAG